MKRIKHFTFTRRALLLGFLSAIIASCTKSKVKPDEDKGPDQPNKLQITGIIVPSSLIADKQSQVTISGKGFLAGDVFMISSVASASLQYTATIKQLLTEEVTFILPEGITSGSYRITVKRGTETLFLGNSNIELIFNANIPDKPGMTVKGVIHAQGVGLANIVVSDGIEVTKTDANGIYYLASNKTNGFVFVSIPGNYEVDTDRSAPLFYKLLTQPAATVEIKDFKLTPVDNNKHVVLAMADLHLANRNNDISQFETGFLADANNVINSYKSNGTKVYGLTLGDMTWDGYWYENKYFLSDYLTLMNKINAPVFNVMGNHDNDPYVANDRGAEDAFRKIIGPTYYSFNLGKVHYIVLDNVEYLNKGGSTGVIGDRDYNARVLNAQIEWLKKDLAMITDKTAPVIVAMHIQLNNNPQVNSNGIPISSLRLNNGTEFINAFTGFSNVNVLTGHTHINYAVENSSTLMEHNTAAVCATWWWTGRNGYAGNHIAKDGSPGGYGIWEFDNKDVKWQYKSIGQDKNYQFRAYDLNKTYITAAEFAPTSTDALLLKYAAEYATQSTKNEVLINVWGYDEKWKVEVTENGTPLTVNRVHVLDPLHIISYSAKRLAVNATPTEDFVSTKTSHMFKVKAANATNSLQIKVTDRFGRVYSETMVRPKALTYLMK